MLWPLQALKQYATFTGRAQRREYWFFILFYLILQVAGVAVDMAMGTFSRAAELGPVSAIAVFGLLVPAVAVTARRLHDTGKSGWWQLLGFIPVIGALILLAFLVKDSYAGTNAYGPNPKAGA